MNITEKLQRLADLRNRIRLKLTALGIAKSTDKMEKLTEAIENIENCGAVHQTLDGTKTTHTVPRGYHNGTGKVTITLESKAATPTKAQQKITPSTGKVLSDVTIAPIPDAYHDVSGVDATAKDVLAGKKIETESGTVTGTMPDNGTVNKTLDTSTVSYTIPKGNHSGTGKVSITPETKTVTPTKSTQNITPTAGKVLSKVTVNAIPDSYVQPTKTGVAKANGTYNVREYVTLSVNVASSGSSLPTSTISDFGSAIGGTWYYIDANGQGQQYKATDWPTVKAIKGSYIIADFAFAASGLGMDGFELVHAYGPVLTTAGEDFYVVILKITGDNPTAML